MTMVFFYFHLLTQFSNRIRLHNGRRETPQPGVSSRPSVRIVLALHRRLLDVTWRSRVPALRRRTVCAHVSTTKNTLKVEPVVHRNPTETCLGGASDWLQQADASTHTHIHTPSAGTVHTHTHTLCSIFFSQGIRSNSQISKCQCGS